MREIDLSLTNTSSASERLTLVLLNYIINELQNSNIDIFNRPCQCDLKQCLIGALYPRRRHPHSHGNIDCQNKIEILLNI